MFLYKGNQIQMHLKNSHENELAGVKHLSQWQCVLEIMKDKELFGVGYNAKENLLTSCYRDKAMYKAESNNLNSHNEYLNAFLTLGYIGVLGMLVYFLNIMFFAYKTKQLAQLLIIILIASFSVLENVFTRQKGVMITSITCLLIFSSKPTKKDE
jgi:O-antigen ligase